MKTLSKIAALLLLAGSVSGAETTTFDLTDKDKFHSGWNQVDSAYYRPLGKVELTDKGVKLTAANKKVNLITCKKRIAINPGDKIELTLELKCEKNAHLYLGFFEFSNRAWAGSDLQAFWVKPGTTRVSKVITIKKGDKVVDMGAVTMGCSYNTEVTFKSVTVRFVGEDAAHVVKPDLPGSLVMHFDGSRQGTMTIKDGRIARWEDISGKGNHVTAEGEKRPFFLKSGVNNRNMVRFAGKQELKSINHLNLPSGITVFLVFRREAAQDNGEEWQDSLYWGDGINSDNTGRFHLTMGANRGEEIPRIFHNTNGEAVKNKMVIGSNAGKRGFLCGDVGEILVFNSAKLSADEINQVRNYLLAKWQISEDDFVRFGPLPPGPKRITDDYPLSDQQNKGKWRKLEAFCDEFNGTEIDRSKWTDRTHYDLGPAPVRVLPDNLVFKDGKVSIVTIYDPDMPSGRLEPRGREYHSFSTGQLQSVFMFRYGYIETRAKVQATSFNNCFWMIGGGIDKITGRDTVPEIDVYELAGKSFAHTYSYNMATHCIQRKPVPKHFGSGKNWKSNFKFTDDFHVYGLEWTPKNIRYYVDGVLVRAVKVKENHWDIPMTVHFSCQPHFDWFGVPDPADFPCAYEIDYFRIWKNPETSVPDDWDQKYKLTHRTVTTGFAYDYYEKHGKNIVPNANAQPAPGERFDLEIITSAAAKSWQALFKSRAEWDGKANGGRGALFMSFPGVASRRDNGEVQYAAPSVQWPRVEISGSAMKTADWAPYIYLAIDFENPNRGIEAATLKITLDNNQTVQHALLMKSGKGTVYWRIPPPLKQNKVKTLTFAVRGSDRNVKFNLTGLTLEK